MPASFLVGPALPLCDGVLSFLPSRLTHLLLNRTHGFGDEVLGIGV